MEQAGASAPRSTATLWGKLAAIEIDFKVPCALEMFGCGLLLMGCIELLLWAYSGDAPGLDGSLSQLAMVVLVCGCAESFRTDGRHSRWHVMECRLGLIIAFVAMLAWALSGSHFFQLGLSNAVFVLVISLLLAMGVLFLTVGSLAIVDQAIELLWGQCSGSRLHRDFRRWVQIGR